MTDPIRPKVLIVAMDAAEPALVDRLMEQNKLPNIARLRDKSARARIRSVADWFVAAPWPSFYTGTSAAEHGVYHYLAWNPSAMAVQPLAAPSGSLEPYWRDFQRKGVASVVIDAPMVYPPPEEGDGVEICGWCTHDCLADPWVHPATVGERIRSEGREPMRLVETQRPLSLEDVERLAEVLNASTRNIRELSLSLLDDAKWDFALVSFTATHMGGHQLWSPTGLDRNAVGGGREAVATALESIYIECDRAVGSLIESLPAETTIILMSLHGMEPNTNCGEQLPEMLRLILAEHGSDESRPFRVLSALRELIPRSWRNVAKDRLPKNLRDWLTGFWRTGGKDWSRTQAFALVPDLQGFVRINLRGRESRGVVAPGAEYDALCDRIIAGLGQFVDADTGEPLVSEATTMRALFPGHPSLDHLPDIAVNWTKTPCASHREIESPFGSIHWPTPGRNFDGRSGNHAAFGFLMIAGPGVKPGVVLPDIDVVDLAPTLYELFGLPKPAHMHGRSFLADWAADRGGGDAAH